MRSTGKVRSFRVAPLYLWLFSIFMAAFVVVSVVVINNFLIVYMENRALKSHVEHLWKLVGNYKMKVAVRSTYDFYLNNPDSAAREEPEPAVANTPAPEPEPTIEPEPEPEPRWLPVDDPVVKVFDLRLEPDPRDKTLGYRFSLRKVDQDVDRVDGLVAVVLKNSQDPTTKLAVSPSSVRLENGEPISPKRGIQFSIRHGKTVNSTVRGVANPEGYDQADVYVFDRDGSLLLKQTLAAPDAR